MKYCLQVLFHCKSSKKKFIRDMNLDSSEYWGETDASILLAEFYVKYVEDCHLVYSFSTVSMNRQCIA